MSVDTFERVFTNLLNDQRLSVWHVSIYMALILLWHKNEFANPFPVSRRCIMELSHVRSIVTYHKCIEQLQKYGYIRYNPSYSYYKRSTIFLDKHIKCDLFFQ